MPINYLKQLIRVFLIAVVMCPFIADAQSGTRPGSTIANPIDLGVLISGPLSNTQNNSTINGFGNNYPDNDSDDIVYKFTVTSTSSVVISHDTNIESFITLLDSDGEVIDECDVIYVNTLEITLEPGTYYIVSEGYADYHGDITTIISLYPNCTSSYAPVGAYRTNPVQVGTLSPGVNYTNTLTNSVCYGNEIGSSSADLFYKFMVTTNATVSVSNCGTSFQTTIYLMSESGEIIMQNSGGGPLCNGTIASIVTNLSPGNYYVVSEGYGANSGNIITNISSTASGCGSNVGSSFANAIDAGTLDFDPPAPFTPNFTSSINNSTCYENHLGEASPEVIHKFYLPVNTWVIISNCGTGFRTSLILMDSSHQIIAQNNGSTSNCSAQEAVIRILLPQGNYFVASEGFGNNTGVIKTHFTRFIGCSNNGGQDMQNAIDIGEVSNGVSYTNMAYSNSPCFENRFGQASKDIYYKFTLSATTDVNLSHCGNGSRTSLVLLSDKLAVIASDDGLGSKCQNMEASIIKTLSAGTYYIVSEKYGNEAYYALSLNLISTKISTTENKNKNSITTYIPILALQDATTVLAQSTNNVRQDVKYLDGLNRLIQTVLVKASPSGRDITTPVEYDFFSRELKKYLPYADLLNNSDGTFKLDARSQQVLFYADPSGTWNAPGVRQNNVANSETRYEDAAQARILEQSAPGSPWKMYEGHTSRFTYTFNNNIAFNPANKIGSRRAVLLTVGYGTHSLPNNIHEAFPTLLVKVDGLIYGDNQLEVKIIKDENWNESKGCLGTVEEYQNKDGKLILKRTYNESNGLTEMLSTYYVYDNFGNLNFVVPPQVKADDNGIITQNILDGLCYQYRYDSFNRLIAKKIPGAEWVYFIFNYMDKLIASQDGEQRKYASWTITKYDNYNREIMKGIWVDPLQRTAKDLRLYIAQHSNSLNLYDKRNNSALNGYELLSFPTVLDTVLAVNYYDNYDIPGLPVTYQVSSGVSNKTMNQITASKSSILGTHKLLWDVSYYDDYGRKTISFKQHFLNDDAFDGNYDKVLYNYNFIGDLESASRFHYVNSIEKLKVSDQYTYDHMGRKISTLENINNQGWITLNKLEYNEVGQLKTKRLHSTDNITFLQHTDFDYNERGWLKNSMSNEFSVQLKYDDPVDPLKSQYNGNISSQSWVNGLANSFTYDYDQLNRLLYAGTTAALMSEELTYDVMGNIKTMSRDGGVKANYNYIGNQLDNISVGPLATPHNYVYDANGNATVDGRSGAHFTYNNLNLPKTVVETGVFNLNYTYNALGQKLKKASTQSNSITDYIDGIVYTNGAIEFIQTEDGIARSSGNNYSYEYNLKDHLGNVRTSFYFNPNTLQLEVLQRDDYYAFGLRKDPFVKPGLNNYLYNGKELQDELGQYDYGARLYDPVVGRWNVLDPKGELLEMSSPYVYALNSPVNFIDKDGELPIYINGKTSNDSERGRPRYWDEQLLRTIASSGIPNPGGTSFFVDGNVGSSKNYVTGKRSFDESGSAASGAWSRRDAGKMAAEGDWEKILAQLEKDPKTGKITEKIQIYTHSRGGAFGSGYTEALLKMIKDNSSKFEDPTHVIDYVLNLAPHQSNAIDAPEGVNSFSIDHEWDILSGNDMGNNTGFKTNTASGSPGLAHKNKAFNREVGVFIKSFQKNQGDNKRVVDEFIRTMRSYGITVTIN